MADILFGTVKDNVDPDGLGRVTVALADHGQEVVLPWIRVVQPIAGLDTGMLWLPEIDDNVVVLKGGEGLEKMLVLGSVYSGNRKPPGEAKVEHKHVLTKGGNEILIDDTDGAELIKINTKDSTIEILLDNAVPEVTVTAGDNFTLTVETAVTINATDVDVVASGNVTVKGDSKVTVEGGAVEIKGSTVKVKSSAIELG